MEKIGYNADEWFKRAMQRCIDDDPPKEGDFDVNGILHCGVCKEPKRQYYDVNGEQVLTTRACKCVRDERERKRRQEEYENRMKQVKRLKSVSLMDEVFANATFENFDITDSNRSAYRYCLNYARKFGQMFEKGQGLLLYGAVGTGKSFSAACIANALMDNLTTVVMTSLVKLLQRISAFDNKYSEEDLIDDLMRPSLLILDDLGAERSTDFALEKVYNIIDSRYRSNKPLILTTNLSVKEMKESTDTRYSRIYDRIFEMCYPIKFDGVSRRRIEAKRRFDEMKALLDDDLEVGNGRKSTTDD